MVDVWNIITEKWRRNIESNEQGKVYSVEWPIGGILEVNSTRSSLEFRPVHWIARRMFSSRFSHFLQINRRTVSWFTHVGLLQYIQFIIPPPIILLSAWYTTVGHKNHLRNLQFMFFSFICYRKFTDLILPKRNDVQCHQIWLQILLL